MSAIRDITTALLKFRDERDWKQFHNSKDLALAISIEASELVELFLWKGNEDVEKEQLKDELADILSYCLLLAEKHDIDILDIIKEKIEKNALKYPVSKAKGNSKKYNELQ
ncbi:nucleotide pyrophosphohydrolase [Pontibacter cellulosilyticus]|uniref:Nucleotide pyrophosphohydrolase n=1 Tax=Pontibacter cellulosilyticus TaxID=1720253 RepID=A0A923N635_9BACT|nr:nucleotide pyrophosphohydrolase [Pontibacter cellulosilyticus]MBC5992427.1 nucleotide pyrophosphohydrolase [Pontibacter cellulosilyticus]